MSPKAPVPKCNRDSMYVSYCLETWSKCCFTLLNSINTTSRRKKIALYFHTEDPTVNLCFRESSWIRWEMLTPYVENKHRHCCLTDQRAEAGRNFTQGHEGSWKWSWDKRLVVFTCQLSAHSAGLCWWFWWMKRKMCSSESRSVDLLKKSSNTCTKL